MSKEICGHCVSYDMWCGVCLNPESEAFVSGKEYIYEDEACGLFCLEESYGGEE